MWRCETTEGTVSFGAVWQDSPPSALSLAGAATSIIFVATKVFLRQTHLLSPQAYFCRDKHIFYLDKIMFVATCLLLSDILTFVATNTCLSRQHTSFVVTKHVFCRDKSMLVATHTKLSWQTFWRGKRTFVATKINGHIKQNFCRNKNDTYGRSRQW